MLAFVYQLGDHHVGFFTTWRLGWDLEDLVLSSLQHGGLRTI